MARQGGPDDRYLLRRVLGEGGAGRVWLVEDSLRPGSPLALKEPFPAGSSDLRHEEELRKEFATLAGLRHPNLVEVHEFDTSPESGLPRFTLEFIQGRDIVDAIAHEGPRLFMDLTAEALRALEFLHDFNLIHGDLKPSNLLVRDTPKLGCRLVFVDFGLARAAASGPLEAARAKGTLPYVAPEMFRNEGASRRTDLYALGAVLYEAAFGNPPFVPASEDLTAFIEAVSSGPRSIPPLETGYPPGLEFWLAEMLSPDPAGRPSTALEALARFNEACGTGYPAETPVTRTARLLSGAPAEREAEISRILGFLDPGAGPRVVWLCGGPGSGKTRILRWLESVAILKGWHVVAPDPRLRKSVDELRAAAASRPVLVLLDEVDASTFRTIEFLDRVAREADRPPLQVVAALRPGEITQPALKRLLLDTGTVPTLRRVDLGRLREDGIRAMARRALGGSVSSERVQWLSRSSEGSPAVAESLLIEGAWERGGRGETPRLRGAMPAGRIEVLSAEALRWLEALAVLRRDAEDGIVASLCGMDAASARAAAEETAAAGLAYRKRGRWFPDSRALVEEICARIEPPRRRALHETAARILEAGRPETVDPSLLFELWKEAGAARRAIECAIRAGEQSLAAGDPASAAARFGQALRLAPRSKGERFELRGEQADALMASGMYAAAARAFAAASRFAPGDPARAEILCRLAYALVQAGRFRRALEVAERAASLASTLRLSRQLAEARKVAGMVLGRIGKEEEAIPLLEGARDLVRELHEPQAEAEILQILGTCRDRLGKEGAENDFRRAIELYRAGGRGGEGLPGPSELKAIVSLAVIRARGKEPEGAARLLEEVHAAAAAAGNLSLREVALSKLAVVAIEQGKLDRAMDLARQAADLALHLGDHNLILVNNCRLADAMIRCGRAGEAMALLRQTLDKPLARVEPENVDYARMLLANAWMESGAADEDRVRELLDQSLAGCRKRRKRRALLMALVIEMERRARTGCPDPFEPVEAQLEAAIEMGEDSAAAEIRFRADLARSAYRISRGDPEGARDAAGAAAATARGIGALAFEARALALLAEALDRLAVEDEAEEARLQGRKLLEQAAARIESEEVRRLFLERPVYASLRRDETPAGRRNQRRLLALYDMIRTLNSEADPDALLESILDMALRAVKAERGMILLKGDGSAEAQGDFTVRLARNLERETVQDAESYSRSIVAAAGAGRSLLALDAENDERFRELKSVSLYGIRSLLCVPLRSRGAIVGTVYLDSRRDGAMFTLEDLRFLEAFADHAALALENARTRIRLERENRELRTAAEARTEFASIVGRSAGMQAVFDLIGKVATTELPVLIQGESGTGKELVARAVHFQGPRRRKTFLSENCAAIPESLLESELFGHVRGAFTGADRDRAGLFELADGGTLMLDEVGDMSLAMQARLLRVLEEKRIRRVGGEKAIPIDVRVVAATHRDLAAEVEAGRFRQDLLYRLQVLTINLPPLRKRPGDVALLTSHFLDRVARERGRNRPEIDDAVLGRLESYSWPGNVRELQNTLQRLAVLAGGGPITLDTVASDPELRAKLVSPVDEPRFSLRSGQKEQIERALAAARGSRSRAADLLGISRATLYRKLREHKL